ncbi:MAG: DUF2141 domain-containing protein [Pseudomonadota bacterium]
MRKQLFTLLWLVAMAATAEVPPGILQVEITGLKDETGDVYIAIYRPQDDWLGDEAFASRKVVIAEALEGEVVAAEFELPVGDYAFTAFHDANGNGELDTNFFGLPKESIAMSNNAKAKFGPPKYEDAVFVLELEPVIQRVSMGSL